MSTDREPSAEEHEAMRRAVLDAAGDIDRRRRHRTQFIAAAAAVVLIGGTVTAVAATALSTHDVVASTPTPSATETQPAPTPTPLASPTASPTTSEPLVDPEDPSTWLVTAEGMGPFTLGMPFEVASATAPSLAEACPNAYSLPDNSLWIASSGDAAELDEVMFYGSEDAAGGPRTAGGLGLGSAIDDVRTAYPDAVEVYANHLFLQAGHIVFGYDDTTGIVDQIGVVSETPAFEYCG